MLYSAGRDTCRHGVSPPPRRSHSPASQHCFQRAVRPGRPRVWQPFQQPRQVDMPRQVDVGRDISGEAGLSPCPVHTSQNREEQSEVWSHGWNVKSGHWDSQALIILVTVSHRTTPPRTQFPLSRRSGYAESQSSRLSGPHQWNIGGTEQMGLFLFVHFTCSL